MFPTDLTSTRKLAYKSVHCSLRFIIWLVYLYNCDLFWRPDPLSSTCHSSLIIKEVPASHTAVVCLLLFSCAVCCSTCFLVMNAWVANRAVLSVFWERWSCRAERNVAEKSACIVSPAISFLSQSLHSAAAAETSISWTDFEQLFT